MTEEYEDDDYFRGDDCPWCGTLYPESESSYTRAELEELGLTIPAYWDEEDEGSNEAENP